eukprot:m.180803 g.180803  ORF g.180803 m.180803 type:complete len:289 (+) comp25431_c0_seq5:73-939(+)
MILFLPLALSLLPLSTSRQLRVPWTLNNAKDPVDDFWMLTRADLFPPPRPHFAPLVSHKHKLILCAIPKVGTTQWRSLYRRFQGISYAFNQDPTNFTYLEPGQEHLFDEYFSLAIVRDPFSRLLSGYLNKIKMGPQVFPNLVQLGMNRNTTFSEFVRVILTEASCSDIRHTGPVTTRMPLMNEHWMPQFCFCGLTRFKYSYIGHHETPQETVEVLRKMRPELDKYLKTGWGTTHKEPFFAASKEHKNAKRTDATAKLKEYYTPPLVTATRVKYRRDFELFDYDETSLG